MMSPPVSHYLYQAVPLLDKCQRKLQQTIDEIAVSARHRYYNILMDMNKSLAASEQLLYSHIIENLDDSNEEENVTAAYEQVNVSRTMDALERLKRKLQEHENIESATSRENSRFTEKCLQNPQEPYQQERQQQSSLYNNTTTTRIKQKSFIDILLFRLIVTLQLLLVRIDDAHYVITGHRIKDLKDEKNQNVIRNSRGTETSSSSQHRSSSYWALMGCCGIGMGLYVGCACRRTDGNQTIKALLTNGSASSLLSASVKVGASFVCLRLFSKVAKVCWMSDKIYRSDNELKEWMDEWRLIHRRRSSHQHHSAQSNGLQPLNSLEHETITTDTDESLGLDDKTRTLIEHAMKNGRKSYFWRSTGEIRFLMVKRFMDVYYASVGTAINTNQTSPLGLSFVTGAAASFYSITGVSKESLSGVVNSSSRDLIQHAWGMVSLPALKSLMLQASRLIKGAAVADRIDLCGVPCFILSKDPAPELAAALKREAKRIAGGSTANLSQLSTITETETHFNEEESSFGRNSFAGTCGEYRQRDVILHLTGGGFFAHTIASDLPYLLDWSSSTGAVVVCPEYALLPENHFPIALDEISNVYSALASGNTGKDLGFEVNRICVTGESAGGNLAAALCVKIAMHNNMKFDGNDDHSNNITSNAVKEKSSRMPDSLMLSCAALNLTNELSYSRVVGREDPVLPNALISAISEAYLPSEKGFNKKDPLASPFYASDEVLKQFPPTLLFASSKDPLLDDSVTFNERLRVLGVDSELIAAHNVPHAYFGLGTAGFPEAIQVQEYAMHWLSSIFKATN